VFWLNQNITAGSEVAIMNYGVTGLMLIVIFALNAQLGVNYETNEFNAKI